jgi:hypothetical protein
LYRKDGCRAAHSKEEMEIAKLIFVIERHRENQAISYVDASGYITLYGF